MPSPVGRFGLVAYVSGHGYGHATRVGEVLRAVRMMDPHVPLAVATSGPERLYRQAVPGPFEFRGLECDVGLVQKGALVMEESATVDAWRAFVAGDDARIAGEARWLREIGARAVLGDIPPLAFTAAAEAGVRSFGLSNFSWDWIYRYMSVRHPGLADAADWAAAAYRRCGLLLQLPFSGDLAAFPRREQIPLVARKPNVDKAEARKRLGLPDGRLALVSFGGLGLPGFDPGVLEQVKGWNFLLTGIETPGQANSTGGPANATGLDVGRAAALGLTYVDLVGAADVVITKPGYGIVSDAIAARTRMVYTERGDFPEYPILVGEMTRWLPARHVSNDELLAGRVGAALRDVLEVPFPDPPDTSGAERAARRLLEA
jgi:L-arabinokinase